MLRIAPLILFLSVAVVRAEMEIPRAIYVKVFCDRNATGFAFGSDADVDSCGRFLQAHPEYTVLIEAVVSRTTDEDVARARTAVLAARLARFADQSRISVRSTKCPGTALPEGPTLGATLVLMPPDAEASDVDEMCSATRFDVRQADQAVSDNGGAGPRLIIQAAHGDGFSGAVTSAEGRFIATWSQGPSAILWDARTGRELRRYSTGGNIISFVAISADGRFIVVGDDASEVALWRTQDGAQLWRLSIPHAHAAAFHPLQTHSFVLALSSQVDVVDTETGARGPTISNAAFDAIHFTPDGLHIAGVERETRGVRRVAMIDTATRSTSRLPLGSGNAIGSPSRDARWVVVRSEAGVGLRNLKDGRTTVLSAVAHDANSAAFSRDGAHVAIASEGELWTYYVATGKAEGHLIRRVRSLTTAPHAASFLVSDGAVVEQISSSGTAHSLALRSRSELVLDASIVDSTIYATTNSGLRVWDLRRGEHVEELTDPRSLFRPIGMRDGGRTLLCQTLTGVVAHTLHDARVTVPIPGVALNDGDQVVASRDGALLAVTRQTFDGKESRGTTITVYDSASGCLVWHRRFGVGSPRRSVYRVAFDESQAEHVVVMNSGGQDDAEVFAAERTVAPEARASGYIRFQTFNLANGELVRDFVRPLSGELVTRFVPSPAGALFATGSADGGICIWDVVRGHRLSRFKRDGDFGMASIVFSMAFDSTGDALVAGFGDGAVLIADVPRSRIRSVVRAHDSSVTAASYDANGLLITSSLDGSIQVWPAASVTPLFRLIAGERGVWCTVAADGRFDTTHADSLPFLYWAVPDEPYATYGVDLFLRDYFEPRLAARLLSGDRFVPRRPLLSLNRARPEVRIVDARQQDRTSVCVTVEVREQTSPRGRRSGAYDLRLLRDGMVTASVPDLPVASPADIRSWRRALRLPTTHGVARLTFTVKVSPRRKSVALSAYAFNDDQVKSETATARVALADVAPPSRRVIVVGIGIGTTVGAPALRYTPADVREILLALRAHFASQSAVDAVHVETVALISDAYGPSTARLPTRRAILDALSHQRAGPDDEVIIYIAGHAQVAAGGRLGLLPYRTLRDADALVTSDDLAVALRHMDGHVTLIIDVCHAAAAIESDGFKPAPLGSRGLGQLAYDKKMTVLVAADTTTEARNSGVLRHSLVEHVFVQEALPLRASLPATLRYVATRVPKMFMEMGMDGAVQRPAVFDFSDFGLASDPNIEESR